MRKAILLAMAAAIVAMFAIPGTASAAWTKDEKAITENVELEITGTDLFFEGEFGGVTCIKTISKVHFEAANGGTTGTVTTFEPELNAETPTVTSDCQGTGPIQQCDVHEAKGDGLPWVIHTVSSDTVSITTGTITNKLSGFLCPSSPDLTPGTVHITVAAGQTNTTSTGELNGSLKGDGPAQNVSVHGTVHVLGTVTYGI